MNKKVIANLIIVAAVFFGGGFFLDQYLKGELFKQDLTPQQAEAKAKDFIEGNLVQEGTEVKVKGVAEENNLYKITIDLQGQELTSYLTKDGSNFFPQAMNIEEIKAQKDAQAQAEQEKSEPLPKSETPQVESFVMSYCPYGTQVQKGLLPVIETLGDKMDFSFKFVDYAMHEEKEVMENLRQYCIDQADSQKYYDYLECFLASEDSDKCLAETGVNESALTSCMDATDQEYEITKKLEDKDSWESQFPPFDIHKAANEKYGVQGSPTMIINGQQTSSARDPQSLLDKICTAFEEKPAECDTELSSETPAPGFGEEITASASDASCG
ncbi:MAG: hypothetical protein U5L10_01220 [Candidatus Moranbacteria bacterium]|nr:hypothetical protein [Candidatus Moranbacteria bacterium]